jgi:hypothetical protein
VTDAFQLCSQFLSSAHAAQPRRFGRA